MQLLIHRVLALNCAHQAHLQSVLSAGKSSVVTAARLALMSVSPSLGLISIPATHAWAHELIDYKDKIDHGKRSRHLEDESFHPPDNEGPPLRRCSLVSIHS